LDASGVEPMTTQAAYGQFLRTALPRLGLRWSGFRKVRGQVIKRIKRRLEHLRLPNLAAYAAYLEHHPDEWQILDTLCRITISRCYRDAPVFERLRERVFPALARLAQTQPPPELRCWSAGCASGEEAYSLKLLWQLDVARRFPDVRLRIVATDVDQHLLARARRGRYRRSSLRELPPEWITEGFERLDNDCFAVREAFRDGICFVAQDLRQAAPAGRFHLIACRNLAFTYFDAPRQRTVLARLAERLVSGGVLVVGYHEALPRHELSLSSQEDLPGIYWKQPRPSGAT
jgi:chemotaxis protein methyltransferase CheR